MNAIEVKHVTKRFGELEVLKDVNLTVQRGEIFTLLGANGAGKSTLINILTTLSRPNSGTVTVGNLDALKQGNQMRQLISLNAQATTLDDEFSGYENLHLIATLRNVRQPKVAIAELADKLQLTSFLNRKVRTYSGGMRRRLDIAMSLLGDPAIIFLDEPTTGVDPQNRLALWQIVRNLRDSGKTVFLTTQYLDEADALSDHIAFIHDGRIVRSDTPAGIKRIASANYTIEVADVAASAATQTLDHTGIDYQQDGAALTVTAADAEHALQVLIDANVVVQHYNLAEATLETVFLNLTQEAK
jgi:ABC-2 type transport system ATP-binding protein